VAHGIPLIWTFSTISSPPVFDLEKLEYLSSTGLRVFLMMAKRLGSENLFVDNANEFVREIFDTTGFSEVVVIR
jgi:anti-sigma B factor antagonist